METVKFLAPKASVDLSFWEKLYKLKLNKYRISSDDINVKSYIIDQADILLIDASFCEENDVESKLSVHGAGTLRNVNTTNEFISMNKPEFLSSAGGFIWEKILSGDAVDNTSCLFDFVLLTYADLKQYKFIYWFGYPALVPEKPYKVFAAPTTPSSCIPPDLLAELTTAARGDLSATHGPVFALVHNGHTYLPTSLGDAWTVDLALGSADVIYVVRGLGGGDLLCSGDDPASPQITAPWCLRNVLALLAVKGAGTPMAGQAQTATDISAGIGSGEGLDGRVVKIWVMGAEGGGRSSEGSLLTIFIPTCAFGVEPSGNCSASSVAHALTNTEHPAGNTPQVVGWATNERGKPGPRTTDASSVMDTKKIMEQAVDLNLRLMKWRMWPDLDTEMLAGTKCLLLGAGTLGCAVARTLMGWGVRDIVFVDNGRVSYSNPARQSLFEYEDCVGSVFKSTAAAARLQKIFPGMRSRGEVLTIPMPGHPIPEADREAVRQTVATLDDLVRTSDVVFALTDSREARWLPTVMCSAHDKLMVNSALGFDSYLIMRHGHGVMVEDNCDDKSSASSVGNSQRDKTLDQQCTVTRPGLAQIASGFAAELMVAVLHARERQRTSAKGAPPRLPADGMGVVSGVGEGGEEVEEAASIPHQIRGFLTSFMQVEPVCLAFPNCTACSRAVVSQYATDDASRFEFIESVCANSEILEHISGVAELTAGLDDLELMSLEEGEEDDW